MLSKGLHDEISRHILDIYPNECVGLVIGDEYVPLCNVSDTPKVSFRLAVVDRVKYFELGLHNIKYLIHSHITNPQKPVAYDVRAPSNSDIHNQLFTKCQWLIYSTDGKKVTKPIEFPIKANNNYIGRRFLPHVNDCFTLVRDWYQFELGVNPLQFKVDYDFYDMTTVIENINVVLSKHFQIVGSTYELEYGDILCIDTLGYVANHLGVYIGDGMILEQDGVSNAFPLSKYTGRIHSINRLIKC